MTVTVFVPAPLRDHAGGEAEVVLEGEYPTVGAALDALFERHPGLRDRLLTERGEVRRHVNLFVGSASIRTTGGLETPVPDGAELTILPAVSGG